MTTEAVDQLMLIFKQQAEKAKGDATTQRVLKKRVQAERVHNEESNQHASPYPIPALKVTHPAIDARSLQGTTIISQETDDIDTSMPYANMHLQQQGCTLMKDYLYHMMDMPGSQAAAYKYPLQFLCDFASSVLDGKTGDLLEYHHLVKNPQYQDI